MTEDDESSRLLIFTPESGLCNLCINYMCVKRQVRWKRPQRVGHQKHFLMKLYNSIYTLTHTEKATRFAASIWHINAGDGGVVVQFRAESRELFTSQVRRFRIERIARGRIACQMICALGRSVIRAHYSSREKVASRICVTIQWKVKLCLPYSSLFHDKQELWLEAKSSYTML
jgi:hypothetical protein